MRFESDTQSYVDAFYLANGPCCAGCDFWRWHNSIAGECIKSAPVAPDQRYQMLGISGASLNVGAGHVFTKRDHWCGDFKDDSMEPK